MVCCRARRGAALLLGALLLVLALAPARARAQPAPGHGEWLLPSCAVLEDPSAALPAAEVWRRLAPPLPRPGARTSLGVGFTRSAYFLRCALPGPGPYFIEAPYWPDAVALHLPGDSAPPLSRGRLRPIPADEPAWLTVLLPVPARPAGAAPGELLLRFESAAPLVIAPRLWAPAPLSRSLEGRALLVGCYYGLALVLMVMNGALFIALGQRIHLYYALHVGAMALLTATADHLTAALLWPATPAWSAASVVRFGGLALLALHGFTRALLETARFSPRFDRLLLTAMVLDGLMALTSFLSAAPLFKQLGHGLTALAMVLSLAAPFAVRRRGPVARYFLLACAAYLLGVALRTLLQRGLLPPSLLTEWSWRAGSAIEFLLMSLGLGARVRGVRLEKERAQQEKERAQAELLAEQERTAAELAQRVRERTAELSEALARLKEAQTLLVQRERLASLGELAASVAHEVGNPLNFALGGATELGRRLAALEEALASLPPAERERAAGPLGGARRAQALILSGSARIKAILDGLRAYVRGGPGQARREPEELDLPSELRGTLQLVGPRLREQGIAVSCDPPGLTGPGALPPVRGRPGELGQVFMNLLVNAAEAQPQGGAVRIRARVDGRRLLLTFEDDGPGVAAEARGQLFEPFFTTRREGTGLGLAICRKLVSEHGGTIELVDDVGDAAAEAAPAGGAAEAGPGGGRGARFRLTLPIPG